MTQNSTQNSTQRRTGPRPERSSFRRDLARQLRVDAIRCSRAGGSGHPTSSMSAADLVAVLADGHLRADLAEPGYPGNDHLVFSKGHASPLYYALLKAAGVVTDEELLTFRSFGSRLEGHPTPRIPPTDVATGSLGQGLPIGVGIALAGQRLDRLPYRVWVLCGDSELAEGSVWEAFGYAGWAGLDNLVAIVDVNRLGQTRETMLGWDLEAYAARARAFGWHAVTLDGHDVDEIDVALAEAGSRPGLPTVLFARTRKGRGVAAVEDRPGQHGRLIADPDDAIAELGGVDGVGDVRVVPAPPPPGAVPHTFPSAAGQPPRWEVGENVATRQAYGRALTALGDRRGDVVALDAEVSNSTYSELFAAAHADRYVEVFIAEQQLVAAAVGVSVRRWVPYASTFAAFLSRAHDFVRMAAVSRVQLCLVGSHAGVSIGQDGPSQMALEDLATMRAVHGSVVLHPSDANQTVQLVAAMADHPGISYLRTLRGETPVRTPADEPIRIGGSRVFGEGGEVLLIGCGITVGEALDAAGRLAAAGTPATVVDCYSVKPLDVDTVRRCAAGARLVVTVEDHWPEGGLGEAVLAALAEAPQRPPVRVLGVRGMPVSGTPAELLAAAGIDAAAIVDAVGEALPPRRTAARSRT